MAQNHPGLEILATALDNMGSGDYLRELPRGVYMVVMLMTIALLTAAFVYNIDYRVLNPVFTLVQTAFLVVTYLFLNHTTVFVDLTAPFTAAFAYFLIARTYSLGLTWRRNGHPLFSTILDVGRECQALLLYCQFSPDDRRERRWLRGLLQRHSGLTRYGVAAPRMFKPSPLLYFMYRDSLLLYWLVPPRQVCEALQDLVTMLVRSLGAIRVRRAGVAPSLAMALHAVRYKVDAKGAWRGLAKQALIETLTAPKTLKRKGIHIGSSPAFRTLCHECIGTKLPAELRDAGIRWDESS